MQVYNLRTDETTHKPSATIEYELRKAGESGGAKPAFQVSEKAEESAHSQQMTIAKTLPLDTLAPGRYTLRVSVTDNIAGKSIAPVVSFGVQ